MKRTSLGFVVTTVTVTGLALAGTDSYAEPIKVSGHIEGGFMGNVDDPEDDLNYGRLFDDRANEPIFNQAVLTVEKPLCQEECIDWGFKLQGLYGADARFIHSLGLLDDVTGDRWQPDIVEAFLSFRLPLIGGMNLDTKLGKFVTLEGAETIYPLTNPFYSHTYIFNFGIPFNHTGALFTLHTNETLDLYAGVTRGVNTSIEDNNDSPAFHGGFGLNNLFGGTVSVLATTHLGPETPDNDSDFRYLNDVVVTVKPTDRFTAITDLNYAQDDAADAEAWGAAQYLLYALNDKWTAGFRAEVFRDDDGFFVTQFGDPEDPVNLLDGRPLESAKTVGAGPTTYVALTAGLTWQAHEYVTVRPEVRWDHATSGTDAFNDFEDEDMFTAGFDVIAHF